jgi:ABC-2 type transport system ATP-binding protein
MSDAIIEAKDLNKEFKSLKRESAIKDLFSRNYKTVKALQNINLEIKKGEFIGIIGPNGAGKSTLIKILTGILTPTSGYAKVMGIIPYKKRQENAKNIGVVFGWRTQLWWDLLVKDSYELIRCLYKIPRGKFDKNLRTFSSILNIDDYLKKPVRKLSLGERVRCDLAASLLYEPPILFLDEPTIGLDVVAKQQIRDFLTKINKEKNVTIIITTHDMRDIEELCERIVIVDKGKKIYDGSIRDIKKKFGTERVLVIDFEKPIKKNEFKLKGMKISEIDGNKVFLKINIRKVSLSEIVRKIFSKWPIHDMTIEEPDIEDIIRRIYRDGI